MLSAAGSFTVFGAKVYTRATGKPVTVRDAFTVRNTSVPYSLRIRGEHLTSAEVKINRSKIRNLPDDENGSEKSGAIADVAVALQATNREVDLIDERIDVAVRGMRADPVASDIVQTGICTIRWGLLASPAYLAAKAVDTIEHLGDADALMYQTLDTVDPAWQLYDDANVEVHQRTNVRLQSDNLAVLKGAALSGMGVCELPLYACREELAAGTLKQVLPGLRPRFGRLALLFPSRRGLTPAARTFADHLKASLLSLLTARELIDPAP